MESIDSSRDAVDELIDRFVEEVRRGALRTTDDFALPPRQRDGVCRLLPAAFLLERCARAIAGTAATADALPQKLGDFEILREIGRGGMGVVYEATQLSLARRVALKALPAAAVHHPRLLNRFRLEALTAGKLHHSHIVEVYGVGQCDGHNFYVMQYIEGQSVKELLMRRRASASRASTSLPTSNKSMTSESAAESAWHRFVARIGFQTAEALAYAHGQGVLHRDLKPANLLIDERDNIWITDFGLAKVAGGGDLTNTGELPGTLRYMAPERLSGRCEPASDVFSLGLVLYEMLAGRSAFDAIDRTALLKQVEQASPEPLSHLVPDVERDLETIVATCLQPEITHRYSSAQALADDCRRFLEDQPIAARRASAAERLARWSRRNKGLAASIVAVGVLVVALIAGSAISAVYFGRQERQQRRLAERNEALAEHNAQQSETLRRNLYIAEMNVAVREATPDGGSPRLARLLDAWRHSQPDLRGWEWCLLDSLCRRDLFTIDAHAGGASAVAYSADGSQLATGAFDGAIKVWNADDGRLLLTLAGHRGRIESLDWSPDGARIASSAREVGAWAKVWDARDGRELLTLRGHSKRVAKVAWSPDGALLASGSDDSTIRLWDPLTGEERRVLHGHKRSVGGVAWNPDGTQIASASTDRSVRIWDVATGRELFQGPGRDGTAGILWSPDGKFILSSGYGGTILADGRDARFLKELTWLDYDPAAVVCAKRGNQFAIAGRTTRTITIVDLDAQLVVSALRGHGGAIHDVAWRPDGVQLASASDDGTVKIWDTVDARKTGLFTSHRQSACDVAWSPDGACIATASGDADIRVWRRDRPGEYLSFEQPRTNPWVEWELAWRSDGRRLACGSGARVQIWEPSSGKKLLEVATGAQIFSLAWGPGDKYLLAGDGAGGITAWNPIDGSQVFELQAPAPADGNFVTVDRLACSPDGRLLAATGRDRSVRVWDLASRKLHRILRHTSIRARTVAWSPDSQLVAAGDEAGDILLWRVTDGRLVHTLEGHTSGVYTVAWQPGGKLLSSASSDSTIRLWNPDSGAQVFVLDGWTGGYLSWSPDGQRFAYNSGLGAYKFYIADAAIGAEGPASRGGAD